MRIDLTDPTLWRYRALLPIDNVDPSISLGEGMTPLLHRQLGSNSVYLKLEYLCPTGSFKDRGAAVLMAKVKEWGIKRIVEDSSGNSGAAIAAYAAAAGIECEIYLPEATSDRKIKQIKSYGAKVVKVAGNRDATADATMEEAQSTYYASHSWNPIFFEGTKTVAYEIWEQLGHTAPDSIVVPIGSGTMLLGMYAGFLDLLQLKQIDRLPRIIAVQSVHCTPVYTELYGLAPNPVNRTVAEGISVGQPVRLEELVEAVKTTAGEILLVEDDEVLRGTEELGLMGVYIEPTSGTVVAGYHQAVAKGLIKPGERVVLPMTGIGLKK